MGLLAVVVSLFLFSQAHFVASNVVRRSFQCGSQSYFTTNNGVITSHAGFDHGHNYGKNLDCLWTIEAPAGMMVELVAQTFDIESDRACSFDYLELFDGNSTSAPTMGTFCGSTFLTTSSSQRFLTLNFITDDSTQQRGFQIFYNFTDHRVQSCGSGQFKCTNGRCISGSYHCDGDDDCGDDSDETNCPAFTTFSPGGGPCNSNEFQCKNMNCVPHVWVCDGDNDCGDGSDEVGPNCFNTLTTTPGFVSPGVFNQRVCGQTHFTGLSGNLSSPDYPMSYPSNSYCVYHIQAPFGSKNIVFTFDSQFGIEQDASCSYDSVLVKSGDNLHTHGPFCGTKAPGQFVVPGDSADIVFTSDDSDEYTGFRLDWKVMS